MTESSSLLVALMVTAPAVSFLLLLSAAWFGLGLGERATLRVVGLSSLLGVAACAALAVSFTGEPIRTSLGVWLSAGTYRIPLDLQVDSLSLPFAGLGALLLGLVAAFSRRYLHLEPGFRRFYTLLSLLGAGYMLIVLSGSLLTLTVGWELVGLSSSLLIAFFHYRANPVRHGLRAFVTYRICDGALITAGVLVHHLSGSTEFVDVGGRWLMLGAGGAGTTLVGALLLFAAMGKSAQVPLTGWLPRAMEGPTPSSAVFYGALSIHLGPYLLLRASSLMSASPTVQALTIAVGATTALHSTFVGRVQTDIKSVLAYASATQVGLIIAEIGLGWETLAIVHCIGHAAVRTLQILRSPSLLHDHHHLERAMGQQLPRTGRHLEKLVPKRLQPWFYRLALERGYLDATLTDTVWGSLARGLRAVDELERRWAVLLAGKTNGTQKVGLERARGAES